MGCARPWGAPVYAAARARRTDQGRPLAPHGAAFLRAGPAPAPRADPAAAGVGDAPFRFAHAANSGAGRRPAFIRASGSACSNGSGMKLRPGSACSNGSSHAAPAAAPSSSSRGAGAGGAAGGASSAAAAA